MMCVPRLMAAVSQMSSNLVRFIQKGPEVVCCTMRESLYTSNL